MANYFESDIKDITRLILVRHGRTKSNKEARMGTVGEVPLDETGIIQAQKVAIRLKDFEINTMYCSPILRARQTADIISESIGEKPIENEDLCEFNFGVVGNLKISDIAKRYPEVYVQLNNWLESVPGSNARRPQIPEAETIEEFARRVKRFCDSIRDGHPSSVVAAVSHMSVIKCCLTLMFGGSIDQHMNYNPLNTSITVIDFYHGNPVLNLFNDVSHLDIKIPFGKVHYI